MAKLSPLPSSHRRLAPVPFRPLLPATIVLPPRKSCYNAVGTLCVKDELEGAQRVTAAERETGTLEGEQRGGEGRASGGASRGPVCPGGLQLSRIRHLFFSLSLSPSLSLSLSLSLSSSSSICLPFFVSFPLSLFLSLFLSFSFRLDTGIDRHARTMKLPARVGSRISCATRGTARRRMAGQRFSAVSWIRAIFRTTKANLSLSRC